MTTLNSIIPQSLKNSSVPSTKLLHKLIFGNDGDRLRRIKLKCFSGFTFKEQSPEFEAKIKNVKENFKLNDLIVVCGALNIKYDGTADEITKRIVHSLTDFKILKSNLLIDGETDDEENPIEIKNENSTPDLTKLSIAFNDVTSIIKPFNGSEYSSIDKWIREFEDLSSIMQWSDIHKFVFAKKSLSGVAKLFIQSQNNANSWENIKSLLQDEFGYKYNSAQLHKILAKRQMQPNETVHEYFYKMSELASQGKIEDDALFEYVIAGISDYASNKTILYGATDIHDFREKLKVYEKFRLDASKRKPKPGINQYNKTKYLPENSKGNEIHCFSCGKLNHKSNVCPDKSKGIKCFKCQNFGHVSTSCKRVTPVKNEPKSMTVIDIKPVNKLCKSLTIGNSQFEFLTDTGSDVNVLRNDVYNKINKPPLTNNLISLAGIGDNKIRTQGSFTQTVTIDGENFDLLFHVVEQDAVKFEIIIGTEILKHASIQVDQNGVTFKKNDDVFNLLQIGDISNSTDTEIELHHIHNKNHRDTISSLVKDYKPKKTETTNVKMKILLTDEIPVYQKARRLSLAEKKEVDAQIETWLNNEIIRPSSSDFASAVVLVKKKNGGTRCAIDYRNLNKKIIRDRFPLPIIDDVLDTLHSSAVFSTIDLKNGFMHVDVEESSRKYTSFVVPNGQYEFLKMPFGLATAPSVFERYVSRVFKDLINDGTVVIYMDDIIIPSINEEEGIKKLRLVFETASKYGLEINFNKSQFLKRKVEFLGYIIENGTIRPSPLKTTAVQNFPEPTTLKDVQSFLGLTGYFRKFLPNYALIAKPLSDLLRGSTKFTFDSEQKTAFTELKNMLCNDPILHLFTPGNSLELHTDASKYGFGAILLQKANDGKFHPIHYMSKKTSPAQEKYSSYELEVLAIIEALKKFRIYLWGTPFKIVTDCSAFQKTMSKNELTPRVARWALFLEDFQYEIIHRPGKNMRHVDALSRHPIMIITTSEDGITCKIKSAQTHDDFIHTTKQLLTDNKTNEYFLKNDILYKYDSGRELLVVPQAMATEIITKAHEQGHFATQKTEEVVKRQYFIPQLKEHIERVLRNCIHCILANKKGGKKEGFLNPIEKENRPLNTYHVDFIGPLPSTNKQYQHIFTVIDAFTKFTWLYPVKSITTQDALHNLKIQQKTFGNPFRIISDKGTAFTSKNFSDYCTEQGIEHIQITAGVPRGNGQVERIHGILIPVLTKLTISDHTKWYKYVDDLQRILNSTVPRSTKWSPFELLIGTKMKNKNDINIIQTLDEEYKQLTLNERHDMRNEAKENILKLQRENKQNYNRNRKNSRKYKEGDMVAIKRTQFGTGLKLRVKFFGPYQVTKVKLCDRYEVKKIGQHEGPILTSTNSENMKPWTSN